MLRTVLRGFTFDRTDAIVFGLFLVVLTVTALGRRWVAAGARAEAAAPRTGSGTTPIRLATNPARPNRARGSAAR